MTISMHFGHLEPYLYFYYIFIVSKANFGMVTKDFGP